MLPQYQFECLLGRGGMGAVFKAVQISLDRAVAIKVLPEDLIDDCEANFVERFKNEARTMAKMSHPAIVKVHDFGETADITTPHDDGYRAPPMLFFVMEFIDGTDVSKMIISQGKLPAEHALAITAHVCDALHYAHTRDVIHRDIKPANVLIDMEGRVKVADFGLAKASDAGTRGLTRTNMAMGTPDFIAPEATIDGVQIDGRADIYAVGVMLYQMLTGNIPRGMWTMPSIMAQTDPRFDAIIARAMQIEPAARHQTAMELRRELDVILTVPYVKHDDQRSSAAIPKHELIGLHRQQHALVVHRGAQKPAIVHAGQPSRRPQQQQIITYEPQKSATLPKLAAAVVIGAALFYGMQKWSHKGTPPPARGPVAESVKVAESVPGALTSTSAPVPSPALAIPTTPRVGSAGKINLLASDVVHRDAVRGEWQMTPGGLVCSPGSDGKPTWQMLCFNTTAPEEYDFEADFTLVDGTREASLILPIRGRSILWKMGFKSNDPTPFCFGPDLDGLKPDDPARTEAMVLHERLKTGQRYRTMVEVRRDSLRAFLDGMEVLRWAGDLQRLRLNSTEYAAPDPTRPGVGGYNGTLVFHRAEIFTRSTAANAPALSSVPPTPADALVFGGHRYEMVRADISWNEAKTRAEAMGGHLATLTAREEDEWVRATFIESLPDEKILHIGGVRDSEAEPWRWITGEPWSYTQWRKSATKNPGGIGYMKAIAENERGWNGWSTKGIPFAQNGPLKGLSRVEGFLVEWDQNTVPPAPAPALASSNAPLADTINLVAGVDVKRDAVRGNWEMRAGEPLLDGVKDSDGKNESSSWKFLCLRTAAPEEYDFEVEFTIVSGGPYFSQVLPVPGGVIEWKSQPGVEGPEVHYGFGPKLENRWLSDRSRTKAVVRRPELTAQPQRHYSVVEVRKGSLRAVLDGREMVKWSGDFKSFERPDKNWPDPKFPGVGGMNTVIIYHKAELRVRGVVSERLAQLEAQFEEAYERDVTQSASGKALADLDTKYLAAIDRALADATKAGKLDDITALNDEKKRIADKVPLPPADPVNIAAGLGKLRVTYRKSVALLLKQRDAAADSVYARYDLALAALETELTQKNTISDAQRVRARRDEIEALRHSRSTASAP